MYKHTIEGGAFAELEVELAEDQSIKAEGGRMSYMDGSISMETQSGGFMKGLKRSLSGESFFQNTFTGPGKITFANSLPGEIIPLEINQPWLLSRDAYMAGSPHLEISSKWGGAKSLFGGEGAFLTHISSPDGESGVVFAGGYGYIKEHDVAAGDELVVDTGIFFACPEGTQFTTSKVGGKKSFVFGGEGFVMRFMGPCKVYTQSRAQNELMQYIMTRMPSS
ncbi:MAG: TIGR00266 family protein [Candidatus Kariarchaeaceae archaeon]|jgi:uncharacterized protein (TIGR00266 family)